MKIYKPTISPKLKQHIFITLLGAILGWLVFSFINSSVENMTSIDILFSVIFGIFSCYLIYAITIKLDKLFPWHLQLTNRFISGILLQFLSVFATFYVFFKAYNSLYLKNTTTNGFDSNLIKFAIILFILILLYSIFYFALYSYYTYAKHQIEIITYERKQIDLQLKALKSQLSPHFLFNSLNTISSLIHNDVNTAETYIRELGEMYDYTLKSYYSKMVDLKEEIDFLNSYLTLIQTRYNNRFNCNLNISPTIEDYKIPPLTLQMLVENAVKHNQMDSNTPLNVELYIDDDAIIVKNNITKTPKNVSSFNIGLKNIRDRFTLLQKPNIEVIKDENFTVKVPLLQ